MKPTQHLLPLFTFSFLLLTSPLPAASAPTPLTLPLPSLHQGGNTTLFILLPDSLQNATSTPHSSSGSPQRGGPDAPQESLLASRYSLVATPPKFPVLYILPTASGSKAAQSALAHLAALDAANKYQAICVAPSFNQTPWFADHPTNPAAQQERHLLETVLPFIEKSFPANTTRLLVGFSKSGWGAFTLLFRHPGTFTRAASWDAPLTTEKVGKWGSLESLATQENYDLYSPPNLIKTAAPILSKSPARLILLGHGLFTDDLPIHAQLLSAKIPHYHDHGPKLFHSWDSGWLPVALQLLFTPDLSSTKKIPIIESPASIAAKKAKAEKSNTPKK